MQDNFLIVFKMTECCKAIVFPFINNGKLKNIHFGSGLAQLPP